MNDSDNATKLAEMLDGHQITDEDGQMVEETTSTEAAAPQEQTTVDDDATAEKSAKPEESVPTEGKGDENEPELVETASDETGKRYVPESRFKEVYAKWKEAERKAKANNVAPPPMPVAETPVATGPIDKADALEIEVLRSTLPQFNPESPEYSRDIDELGYSLYESSKDSKGNYTMTRLQAGRKALQTAKKLTAKVADIKTEARTVKAQQADQGVTSRVSSREPAQVDPKKMSLEEMEAWLKANGSW